MFVQLAEVLRERPVLVTISAEPATADASQIRLVISPSPVKAVKDDNMVALANLCLTGTPEELDEGLANALSDWVQVRRSLADQVDDAKKAAEAAAEAAKAEAAKKTAKTATTASKTGKSPQTAALPAAPASQSIGTAGPSPSPQTTGPSAGAKDGQTADDLLAHFSDPALGDGPAATEGAARPPGLAASANLIHDTTRDEKLTPDPANVSGDDDEEGYD